MKRFSVKKLKYWLRWKKKQFKNKRIIIKSFNEENNNNNHLNNNNNNHNNNNHHYKKKKFRILFSFFRNIYYKDKNKNKNKNNNNSNNNNNNNIIDINNNNNNNNSINSSNHISSSISNNSLNTFTNSNSNSNNNLNSLIIENSDINNNNSNNNIIDINNNSYNSNNCIVSINSDYSFISNSNNIVEEEEEIETEMLPIPLSLPTNQNASIKMIPPLTLSNISSNNSLSTSFKFSIPKLNFQPVESDEENIPIPPPTTPHQPISLNSSNNSINSNNSNSSNSNGSNQNINNHHHHIHHHSQTQQHQPHNNTPSISNSSSTANIYKESSPSYNILTPRSLQYYLSLKIFSSTPRSNSPKNSPRNQSSPIQTLSNRILEDIFYMVFDFDSILPSFVYTDLCLVSKHFQKVIESMKRFILILGISESQSKFCIQWYRKHYRQINKIKFVNNFFQNEILSSQFLQVFQNIDDDPSIDLSDNYITKPLLECLSKKLSKNEYMRQLNLSKTKYLALSSPDQLNDEDINDNSNNNNNNNNNNIINSINNNIKIKNKYMNQFLISLSLNTSIEFLDLSSSELIGSMEMMGMVPTSYWNLEDLNQHSIIYLNLGGLSIKEDIAKHLAYMLKSNNTIETFIYNNNSQGIHHIFKSIANYNRTLTSLNFSDCFAFENSQNVESISQMIKLNNKIKYLDVSKNSFNIIPTSSITFFEALSFNTSLKVLNLSSTSPTNADNILFPYLFKYYQKLNNKIIKQQELIINNDYQDILINNNNNNNYNNLKSIIISNNYPFPDPNSYLKYDFLSFGNIGSYIKELDISNLRLGDQKFCPIIDSLIQFQKNHIIKLNISINRLYHRSAEKIAQFLSNNNTIEDINVGCNFLREGVIKICDSLHSNTSLSTLNLYATQIKTKEAKSVAKLLSLNKTITELDVGLNIEISPILNNLENNQNIKSLHICYTSLKSSFVRLIQRNHTLTHLDVSNSSFPNWRINQIVNSIIKNKSILKLNFSIINNDNQNNNQNNNNNNNNLDQNNNNNNHVAHHIHHHNNNNQNNNNNNINNNNNNNHNNNNRNSLIFSKSSKIKMRVYPAKLYYFK